MRKFFDKAKIEARPVEKTEGGENYDALALQLTSAGKSSDFTLWGKAGYIGNPQKVTLQNNEFFISYGSVYENLAFFLETQ